VNRFEFFIKNEKEKQYHTLALWIVLFNIAFLIWLIVSNESLRRYSVIALAAITVLPFFYWKLTSKKQLAGSITVALLLSVIFLFSSGFPMLGVAVALISLLYFISARKLQVVVTSQEIRYPSFPVRVIDWSEINNVILKDGLLTIDFNNNKLAQLNVTDFFSKEQEKEFNEFCQVQLKAVAHQPVSS